MVTKRETFQGYANYETWAVALWLDNDEELYNRVRTLAQTARHSASVHPHVLSGLLTEDQAMRFNLACEIEDMVIASHPTMAASLWSDLLFHALGRVEWSEVADHFLEVS